MFDKDWTKALIEGVAPMFVAAFLWGVMIVVVILAVAGAGNRWLEVLIAGIGAVGQVFFAWMVLRLGTKQFEFTQQVAKRQARIDTFEHRSELFERFRTLSGQLNFRHLDHERGTELANLSSELGRVFSRAALIPIRELSTFVWAGVQLKEEMEEAEEDGGLPPHVVIERRKVISKGMRENKNLAYKALNDELILEFD